MGNEKCKSSEKAELSISWVIRSCFIPSFINPFNKYLLSTVYVPGSLETEVVPTSEELVLQLGSQISNRLIMLLGDKS